MPNTIPIHVFRFHIPPPPVTCALSLITTPFIQAKLVEVASVQNGRAVLLQKSTASTSIEILHWPNLLL
jgi:hypothetical protein